MADIILDEFLPINDLKNIIWMYIGDYHELKELEVNDPKVVIKLDTPDNFIDCNLKGMINLTELYCRFNNNLTDSGLKFVPNKNFLDNNDDKRKIWKLRKYAKRNFMII
jgi:hypothetical protein